MGDCAMKTYSVLLVEDNPDTRRRLAQAVDSHAQLQLMAAVATCEEARKAFNAASPDVLLTDLGLPDGNGRDLIREIKGKTADAEVMVITVFGDEKHVLLAIEAGASGYLLKDGSSDYIGDSIVQMVEGASPISPAIARHLLKRFQAEKPATKSIKADVPRLTPREYEVLQYVAKGFSAAEVGDLLNLSGHTVTSHVKKIYGKLAVRSRSEAIYEAIQLGILNMDSLQ